MKRLTARLLAASVTTVMCLAAGLRLSAQTAAAPAQGQANASDQQGETVVLSPFVVEASEDAGGYQATATLAGTRVRTDLKDLASSISVVTQQFLQDTGAKNNADLLVYTPSTEVSGIRGNFTGVAGVAVYQENTTSTTTRVRGLDSADNTRDYFLTDIPWDAFNVGRVDLQRGPNSILFGTGSPAGIINNSVNDASFKTAYNVENVIDQYGSVRNSIDFNKVLIDNQLAVRVAAVRDDKKFEQHFAYNKMDRYYGAIRFDPKLFGEGNHTSIRAKYEQGKVRSNNPRELPPVDEITPWFQTGTNSYGNPGLNHIIINQYSLSNPTPWDGPMPGRGLLSSVMELGGWAFSRVYWADTLNFYEGTEIGRNNMANPTQPTGTPIKAITGTSNTGNGIPDSGGNRISGPPAGGVGQYRPYGIPSMSQYAAYVGPFSVTNNGGTWSFPGKAIPGGVYYADTVITDPSIFNFYKQLLDGPNKNEWQNWKAYNVALDQTFFGDRLALELAFDHQTYDQGAHQWLTGSNYAISVDVNGAYADGTTNPNAGRPYVANAASSPSLNFWYSRVRDAVRFIPTYELRASDLLGDTTLAKILGKHNITGLWESSTMTQNNVNWAEYATTLQYVTDNNAPGTNNVNALGSGREFDWVVYLGPNMTNKSTASGANLTGITFNVAPPKQELVWNFNSTWNKPTDPNDPNYVNPAALTYNYTSHDGSTATNSAQSNNPANYVGWQPYTVNWMFDSSPTDYPSLVMSASRTKLRDISKGITYQGHFLDGDLVPTFGWRKDVITSYQTNAIADTLSGFTSLNYPDNLSSRTDVRGETKSWGGVYHLPKALVSKLPGDMTISLLYNYSNNFKADAARLDLAGQHIPNAKGITREYGILITALNEKLSLKINHFKTEVKGATLGETAGNSIAGLGNNAYFIADGTIWGYAWAASLQDGLRGQTPGTNYWDYANGSGLPHNTPADIAAYNAFNQTGGRTPGGVDYVGGTAVVDAWLGKTSSTGWNGTTTGTISIVPLPIVKYPNFFSSYALTPPIDPSIGARTGNLRDSFLLGYNDVNGPAPGGGSTFGNHQTTVDNLSQGTEVELTAQPVKNWNLTLNYAKVHATHVALDPVGMNFIADMTAFMNSAGGQVREWWNGDTGLLRGQWNSSIVAPFAVQVNELGHEAPEVSPWRLNAITTYTFDHGPIKGVFVGGALRTEAGRIIGYRYSSTVKNVISSDPRFAAVQFLTLGGLDVNQPLRGSNETHVDAWVGYTRKIAHNINWRIQVNIRSVGEKDRLFAARDNPDGSVALARIVQGMGWQLTNSFDF